MIFVTVGSMMAFDRLILSMDKWALAHPNSDVLAQIGGGIISQATCAARGCFRRANFRKPPAMRRLWSPMPEWVATSSPPKCASLS